MTLFEFLEGDARIVLLDAGAKLQEQCYLFVHDDERLEQFFTEDTGMVSKRKQRARAALWNE